MIGGAVLELAPSGWVFVINVPVVIVALVLVRRWVPESRNPDPGPWDSRAVALSIGGMLGLVWGVKHAGEHGFDDPVALAAMVVGALGLGLFVRRQARSATPILDVRLLRDRRFAAAAGAVLFVFFGLAGLLLFLTQFLQVVQGHGPLEAGLRLLPLAIAAGVVSPFTGALGGDAGGALLAAAQQAFVDGLGTTLLVAAAVTAAAALVAAAVLPRQEAGALAR